MSLLYFSVGLNGAPFHADYSIAKWTDTSTSALPSLKYMGFTAGIWNSVFLYLFFASGVGLPLYPEIFSYTMILHHIRIIVVRDA